MSRTHQLTTLDTTVTRVRRVSPTYVRVTLAGSALRQLHPCGPLGPRDLRVKLIFPAAGGRVSVLPDLEPGWYPRWRALDPADRGLMRTYTIREARLSDAEPEIDVDFVVHGGDDAGSAGPGSSWAEQAREGDHVTILGPHSASEQVAGIEWEPPEPDPPRPVQVLLAADETAVPAVASILATLPAGYSGDAVLEVPDPLDVQDLPTASGVVPTWLPRDASPHGEQLRAVVRELMAQRPPGHAHTQVSEVDIDEEILWETPSTADDSAVPDDAAFYAWVAGEAGTVRDVRRHLVGECGVARSQVAFMGYWRAGRPESS